MYQCLKTIEAIAIQSVAVDARDHFTCASRSASKNGASSKGLTSRGNILIFSILAVMFCFSVCINAQEQRLPATNFSNKVTENFRDNKFGWNETTNTKGAKVAKDGYSMSGKRPSFNPNPVSVVSTANLPFNPQNNFKVTVNLQIMQLTGHSVFQILLNAGTVVFAIAENDWAVVVGTPSCQGLKKTSKGDKVTLSIQREGTTLYFSHNGALLCTAETQGINSSDMIVSLTNIVTSAEIKINEVVVEY